MDKKFFENPILNSPYEMPGKHWEAGADNRPTGNAAPVEPALADLD